MAGCELLDRVSAVGTKSVIVVGGGAAGLSAVWTLKKRGVNAVLLEAENRVGGRLGGDRVDGFSLDEGADFFCSSYDVAFRVCEELGLPLIRSKMNLGWYRNGRWLRTTVIDSIGAAIRNVPVAWQLGLLSPGFLKLARAVRTRSDYQNFSSDCRITEIDGDEKFGDYLARLGVSETLHATLRGFLEMTMGHIENASAPYILAYVGEMLLKADQIYVPEQGVGALTHALAEACGEAIRVSTPARRVVIRDGVAASVITDAGPIEADVVICAVPATKVNGLIPDLPAGIRETLDKVTYSRGCRVVIGLDHPPLPPGWHGALYPEDETPLLLDRSINLPACVPPGKSTLDMLVGRGRAEELFPLDDDEIKRRMLRAARRNPPPGSALPGDEEGLFTRVYRWREAVCMGPPGMFRAVARMRQQDREVKNLFLAGDYMRVPSVNGALASGIGAAEQAAELLGARPS